jgi:protein SCO1/2
MNASKKNLIVTYVSLFILGIVAFFCYDQFQKSLQPQVQTAKILPSTRQLPAIVLNTATHKIGNADLNKHWTLMYFGYVSCPDICPTTLTTLKQTMQLLDTKKLGDKLQVLFVSVDPKRDTPEKLAQYTQYFDKRFVGATADKQNLDILTRAVGVPYGTFDNPKDKDNYIVDHGSSLILLNPKGEFAGYFSAPLKAELIAQDMGVLMR